MINCFQYILYNLGLISPIGIILLVLHLLILNCNYTFWIIVLLILFVCILVYHILLLKIIKKNVATTGISIKNVPEEADDIGKKIWLAYATPLVDIIFKDNYSSNKMLVSFIILGTAFIWICLSNQVYISPIYRIMGYSHYKIETEFGKKYILISKRKYFNNKNQIKTVKVIFTNLLLHEE